jgi:hypothetical protein
VDKDKDKVHPFTGGYAKMPEAADKAALPGLTTEYKAAGTPENGEVSRLVLIMGQEGFAPGGTAYYQMQYAHIDLGEFGFTANGQVFRFVFSGRQPKLVTVHGRNLLRICDYIALRRMQWIRQGNRDFRAVDADDGGGEPFISKIEVTDWMPFQE